MQLNFFVVCPACDIEHSVDEVETLNIEENLYGEDLLTYRCIQTNTVQKGLVYGSQ